jgi:TonB-linked SusC/RagA family outer membrane protein
MKKIHTEKLYAHLLCCSQQYFRIQVLFSVFLTIGLLSIAPFVHSQSTPAKVTLKIENGQVRDALKQIESQTNYLFVYNSGKIDLSKRVSINVKKRPLTEVLGKVLANTGITYVIQNRNILLEKKEVTNTLQDKNQKKITIRGKVVDSKGEPLIGASVKEKGSTNGSITNVDGEFTLSANEYGELEASYIGYIPQSIPVRGKSSISITLKEDVKTLGEVVVTALGIKRSQKALSYNVQQVSGDELNTVKDANFVNSLAGKVAGVNINASAAGTGGATRVVMRGTKSITSSNNALYVIDGVPIYNRNNGSTEGEYSTQPGGEGISDINPEDIESISVLSGPSAAALYGTNAAQGVILITTKKGKEGKVKISYSNSTTFSSPFIMPEFQNTYSNRPGEFMSWGDKMDEPSTFKPKKFFNTGTDIQNTLALSVGSQRSQTYFSASSTNAQGIIPNNKYNRYNFTFRNVTKFFNDKVTFDVSASYIKQNDKNLMAQGEYFNPLITLYLFPRGENFDDVRMYERYDEGRQISVQHWPWGSGQNPYWIANRNLRNSTRDRYMLSASLRYDINSWMNVTGRVRVDNSINKYEEKRYASTDQLFAGSKGFYKETKGTEKQTYGDILLNINKSLNDFSIAANIGGSGVYTGVDASGFQGALKDMPNLFTYYNIDFKTGRDSYPIQEGWEESTLSLFASTEFGWKSMLYLTLTGRNDWPSALSNTSQKSFFYNSVGLSAILSEMMKLPEFINYLKVRGSWASVGSPIPRGLSQPRYQWDPATGKWKTNTFRPLGKLYPERTNSWEAGVTAKLFNSRLAFDLTWYLSNTKNQTFSIPVSASSGYSSMYVQSGNVRNQGIEMSLGLNNKFGDLVWDTNFTFSYNKNKVVELLDNYHDPVTNEDYTLTEFGAGGVGSLSYKLTKGGTMGDIYISKRLKRDQEGNIWVDPDTKNVVVENLDKPLKVGSVLPKSNLGFKNEFSYKGLNFGFLITARFGGDVVSFTQAIMDEYGVSKTSAKVRDNGGVRINNGTVSAENYFGTTGGKNGLIQNYIYSANNARLQEAHLGYQLPAKWFSNKMNVTCSIVGHNLFMIYKRAPFDPESTASTGTFFQGMDLYMQPSLRNIGFNVNIQF